MLKKSMFLLLFAICAFGVQMKEGAFKKDELLINEINTKFVVVEVNNWNKKFRAFATPTFYFLDKNENKI